MRTGETVALQDETGLSSADKSQGYILTCARAALSDVELDVQDLGDVKLVTPRTLPCRISSLDYLARDVLRVKLRVPPGSGFTYTPGQFIDVIGPGGLRRSYSIANAPAPHQQLELHIRRVDGGAMSDYWFGAAKLNDLLRLHGPLGTFFMRDVLDVNLIFLATGTGIAPIKAMIEGLKTEAAAPRSVSVYWGGRVPGDVYWDPNEIGKAQRFVPVLSRADTTWSGARGHVQDVLLTEEPDWDRTNVYACGSDVMIQDARLKLLAAGLAERRFFSDAFVCSAAA